MASSLQEGLRFANSLGQGLFPCLVLPIIAEGALVYELLTLGNEAGVAINGCAGFAGFFLGFLAGDAAFDEFLDNI